MTGPGYCRCGCGEATNLAPRTYSRRGWVRGQPTRYVRGHNTRGTRRPRTTAIDYRALFWARVDKGDGKGCWIWTGKPGKHGYGRATYAKRQVDLSHRVAWRLEHGELGKDDCVLHHCDVRMCVRPDHLFKGDRGDNARDMAAKGRQFLQREPHRAPRGESHGNHRLTESAVREIRRRRRSGEGLRTIASDFQTTETTVSLIARRRAWAHVEDAR